MFSCRRKPDLIPSSKTCAWEQMSWFRHGSYHPCSYPSCNGSAKHLSCLIRDCRECPEAWSLCTSSSSRSSPHHAASRWSCRLTRCFLVGGTLFGSLSRSSSLLDFASLFHTMRSLRTLCWAKYSNYWRLEKVCPSVTYSFLLELAQIFPFQGLNW